MNRDEILAKSRTENENGDEMVRQAKLKAASISRAVGFLLCILGAFLDGVILEIGLIGLVCWTVYWGMQAAEGWALVAGIRTKYGWIGAVCNTVLFVLFAVAFAVRLMDVV